MGSRSAISRIPVLRILVPFILGILLHRLWHCWWASVATGVLALAIYLTLSLISRSPQGRLRWRRYFVLPLSLAALSLGWLCAIIHCPPHLDHVQRNDRLLCGRIVDLSYTDFSMRMTVQLLDQDLPQCHVMISTRGCDYTMRAGDVICWQARLEAVGNMGNPDEMDYANYLLDSKGIRYQQHLPLDRVKKTGSAPTLLTRLANSRRNLQLQVFNSRLAPAAQEFLSALLLGNSSAIDKATRQQFSAAGVAHVLALSGLHIAIIAWMIWLLLFPLDYLGQKKPRLIITLAAIAAFAVFTGLSPSVLRATIMTGFVFASIIFYRRTVSLNALAAAALLILVFTPSALYSVGFQLSFITVAAVLLFSPLPERLRTGSKWIDNISSTVITSAVAMLATVALTAHYFHTISLMSVFSNLLILPVLPVFMVLGALFLLVTAAGLHISVLDWVIEGLYRYIHAAVESVNSLPFSHLGGVYVSTFGVIAWFMIMMFVVLWLYRRSYRWLLGAGIMMAVLLAHSLWMDVHTPRQGVVIFNSFASTPFLYYDHGEGYVWTPDEEEPDSVAFQRYYAGFLSRHSIEHLHFVADSDSLVLANAVISPPQAHVMGHHYLAVGSGKWKSMSTKHRLTVNDIIVTKRFHGKAAKLQELYHFDRLIISGAMHDPEPLLRECDSLHIQVHDLGTQGAMMLP